MTGDVQTAAGLVEEEQQLAVATGNPAVGVGRMLLEAFRGDEVTVRRLA